MKIGFLSYDEFMAMVKRPDFEQDPEWHGVDDEENFSSQEFMEYERMRQEEYARMQAAGHLPPPPPGMHGGPPPPGMHGGPPPPEYYGYQAPPMPPQGHPQGGYPQVPNVPYHGQAHPGQYAPQGGHPQQGYQQVPQQVSHESWLV